MNVRRQFLLALLLGWAFTLAPATALCAATNTVTAATNAPIATVNTNDFRSNFDNNGRDPFFPMSSRQAAALSENGESQPAIILALKGFSGPAHRRFAIINDHTFAVGEESEVLTAGGRIRVRCVEIRADVAVVTIGGGQKIELRLPSRF
ncbi:MAG: hypothetical protein NTZ16_14250 [Verrucomicrobia bacterium]|nr:hypothetical protein [Verrucomicrobiota bacterium]